MRGHRIAWAAALLIAAGPLVAEDSAELLFYRGYYLETAKRDPGAAMACYEQALAQKGAPEEFASLAQYRIGECLRATGKTDEARAAFQRVKEKYPNQKEGRALAAAALAVLEFPLDEESARVVREMKKTKISLNFTAAPFPDVVTFLREYTRTNMDLDDRNLRDPAAVEVTLRVDEVSAAHAIHLICSMIGIEVSMSRGVLLFTTKEGLGAQGSALSYFGDKTGPDAEEPAWMGDLEGDLKEIRVDLDFTDASLEDIVGFIREYAKFNIEFDAALYADHTVERAFTLALRDVEIGTALSTLLQKAGLEYRLQDEVILIYRPAPPK